MTDQEPKIGKDRLHQLIGNGEIELSSIKYILIVLGLLFSVGHVGHARENENFNTPVRFQSVAFDIPLRAANATLVQDRDGFFWIGSQLGLVKWDGVHTILYTKANSGVSGSIITKILEGRDGVLWFGALSGGLTKYNKETNTFTRYHHDPNNPRSISSNSIGTPVYGQSIIEDKEGILWIGTAKGFNRFDTLTERFTRYRHDRNNDNSLCHNKVLAIYEDSKGILWIGTKEGLNRFDKTSQIFTKYFYDPDDVKSLSHNEVHAIIEDHEGMLWVGTAAGLDRLDRADDTFTRYRHDPDDPDSLAGKTINSIMETKTGDLWITHYPDGKISRFNKARDLFTRYRNNPKIPGSLPRDDIKTIYQDRSGALWFVDVAGGVAKYDPRPEKFRLYDSHPDNPHGPRSATHGVVKDSEGIVWFTTDTGFSKYNPETDLFTSIDVADTVPYVMFIDSADKMWVGEKTGNLNLFDRRMESYVRTYPLEAYINGIREDHDNPDILWITTNNAGLVQFHKQTGDATYYQHDDNDPHSISHDAVWSIYQDDGRLWLGTLGGGVNKFDKTTGVFTSFLHVEGRPETIGSNVVTGIIRTSLGELWLTTLGGGLNKFDENRGVFERYNQSEGNFPSDMLASILEDGTGRLWIAGVVQGQSSYIKFHPGRKTYQVYGADDGVQTGTAWVVGSHQTEDGEIWYTGTKGVNAFYPRQIKENDFIPPVYLTSLKQGGEDLLVDKALEKLDEITLE